LSANNIDSLYPVTVGILVCLRDWGENENVNEKGFSGRFVVLSFIRS